MQNSYRQSYAAIMNMADISNAGRDTALSKGVAKRKYLLQDNDLEGVRFELKDNPVNRSYGTYGFYYFFQGNECV